MKKLLFAIALCTSSLGLASCQHLGNYDPSNPPLADTSVDEKAMFVAETTFAGLTVAIEQAVDTGLLERGNAGKVERLYTLSKSALDQARYAQRVGDSGTLLEQVALLQMYASEIFGTLRNDEATD